MSNITWEEPPPVSGRFGSRGREKTPERLEVDAMLDELRHNQGKWARLYLFQTKEEAKKRANMAGQKGFNVFVREVKSPQPGWAIYARYNGEPETDDAAARAMPGSPSEPSTDNDAVREGSFPA